MPCCNPFGKKRHKRNRKLEFKRLRFVSEKLIVLANQLHVQLLSTERICNSCRKEICNKIRKLNAKNDNEKRLIDERRQEQMMDIDSTTITDDNDTTLPSSLDTTLPSSSQNSQTSVEGEHNISASLAEYLDRDWFVKEFNKLLPYIGIETIDPYKVKKSRSYCDHMLKSICDSLARILFEIPEHAHANIDAENTDGEEMIRQLKNKFAETDDKDTKVKILSVLPISWSTKKIEREFHTSRRLAQLATQVVRENGILCGTKKRVATNTIHSDTKILVEEFYRSDDISRVCAGKRDYVSVNEYGVKVAKQRRLILMNLSEAYSLFKTKNIGRKIGFSTFATLRPKECVLVFDKMGTHAVCVCTYHQNVKLIYEPNKDIFRGTETYRDLMKKMICALPSNKCHLNLCSECPGETAMEEYLSDIFEKNELENISYKQWMNLDGTHNFFDKIIINLQNNMEYLEY